MLVSLVTDYHMFWGPEYIKLPYDSIKFVCGFNQGAIIGRCGQKDCPVETEEPKYKTIQDSSLVLLHILEHCFEQVEMITRWYAVGHHLHNNLSSSKVIRFSPNNRELRADGYSSSVELHSHSFIPLCHVILSNTLSKLVLDYVIHEIQPSTHTTQWGINLAPNVDEDIMMWYRKPTVNRTWWGMT